MTYLSQNLSSERLVLESWGKDQSYSYLILHNKIEKLKFYSLSKPYRSERVKAEFRVKIEGGHILVLNRGRPARFLAKK